MRQMWKYGSNCIGVLAKSTMLMHANLAKYKTLLFPQKTDRPTSRLKVFLRESRPHDVTEVRSSVCVWGGLSVFN